MPAFPIQINLINQRAQVLPGLTVQAWIGNQKAGEALTDALGNCTISITLADPGTKKMTPFAYLMVYLGEKWIYGVKDNPKYALEGTGLNLQVTIQTRRADLIPMTLKDFRRSAENLSELSAVQRNYVAGKLNVALSSAVQQALGEADTRFQETPVVLTQDYTALLNTTLGDVLKVAINTTRAFEIDENVTTRLAQNPRSVREILHIEQPMIKNPIFYEAVQVLRTTNLTDMMLPGQPHTADYLLDRSLDWERASAAQWEGLAAEGIVSEAGKNLLQRGFALSRFTGGQTALVGRLMQNLTDISQIATYDAAQLLAHIKAAGNETPNGESPEEYAANLEKLAQRNFPSVFFLERKVRRVIPQEQQISALQPLLTTYRYLGTTEELSKPEVLKKRHGLLQQFLTDNPGLDLRTADFFQKGGTGNRAHWYGGIPKERQNDVRNQMMSFQRVTRLTGSYEAQDALLAAGLDSSGEIMRRKPAELQTMLGTSLSQAAIEDIMVTAQHQFEVVVNSTVDIFNVSSPQAIGFAVDNYPEDLKNQLRDIDGYDKMFGSQDYCECDHCKSIFGPAAYFVDLMKFTEEQVQLMKVDGTTLAPLTTNPHPDEHPISLRKRRPDLWNLELTCENTNAAVPYLMIINEIKQRYIAEVMGAILPKPAKDVDVWAEFARLPLTGNNTGFRHGLAANAGNTWKNSFRLPFNRPFEESQILLEHFGLTYREVLSALRVQAQYRMDQAYLGLSAEEWQLIVTPDTANLNDLRNLRFGFPAERAAIIDVNIVIDAGFSLAECPVDVFLRATGLSRADAEFLLSDKSSLRTLTPPVNPAVKLERVQVPGEIQAYKEWIVGLKNPIVLDFIHRLLRLQRHLPWTLRELDLVVQTLGSFVIDEVVRIARIREMQRLFNLTVEEALALHQEIPDTSLYTRTVHDAFLNSTVEVAVPGMLSRMFDAAKRPPKVSGIPFATQFTDYKKWPEQLQGLSQSTTEAGFGQLYLTLFGNTPVVLADVSAAWRITRVAKLFGLSLEELGYLTELINMPFWNVNAGRVLTWKWLLEDIKKMPLSLHEIWFVIKGAQTTQVKSRYGTTDILNDGADALMKAVLADTRLYITKEALQEYLPSGKRESHIQAFITALNAKGVIFSTVAGHRIARFTKLSNSDLPDKLNLGLTSDQNEKDPIVLEHKQISDLLNWLNDQYILGSEGSIPEKIFREHLALEWNTNASLITAMQPWYADYPKVWAEIQVNFKQDKATYSLVELAKLLPVFERVYLLFSKLSLDAADVNFINNSAEFIQGAGKDALDKLKTPYDLRRLTHYARFKAKAGNPAGVEAYRVLLNAAKTTWATQHSEIIAKIMDCQAADVKAVLQVIDPNSLSAPDLLSQIGDLVGTFGQLGIYEKTVLNAFRMNTYPDALQYEPALRNASRARYDTEAAYEKAWEPYENRINEQRRDVLCAFLLALDQQNNFRDTGDLYAYFLVDVEMSGCSRVSRILAATLSLQLYEHRVLMGLEATTADPVTKVYFRAIMDEEAKRQWEWRKNYRVWEANRKVFLYPENWIEPELRHDKSPLFKTLEDELLQQKISLESAEQAYIQYLKGFAEVGQLVIAGMYYEPGKETYHIFGRTATDPYQYHYRKMRVLPMNPTTKVRAKQWTAWEKVELTIDAPYVSPIIHNGKLYVFWVGVVTMEKSAFTGGNSKFVAYEHTFSLSYSNLTKNGKWLQPQKMKDFVVGEKESYPTQLDNQPAAHSLKEFEKSPTYLRVYPSIDSDLKIEYYSNSWVWHGIRNYSLELLHNRATNKNIYSQVVFLKPKAMKLLSVSGGKQLLQFTNNDTFPVSAGSLETGDFGSIYPASLILENLSTKDFGTDFRLVFNRGGDFIFRNNNHQYLLRITDPGETVKGVFGVFPNSVVAHSLSGRESILLTTNVIDDLVIKLVEKGLSGFLSLETQKTEELHDTLIYSKTDKLYPPFFEINSLDFSGAHGLYFRELFFHIPFLIADHLNAEGKYKEADYWYRKIFDPSANFDPNGTATDRYWQFLEFRGQTLPKLKEILTDTAAIDAYENNPFNPHAIAQVRSGPYQKAIVMKYIDNLIDWGDSLFRRDTWESNTEAMLLYQLAHDILGKRPQKTGSCESAIDTNNCGCIDPKTTYAKLKGASNQPFVYSIENWVATPGLDIASGSGSVISGGGLIGYEELIVTGQANNTRGMVGLNQTLSTSYATDFGGQLFTQNVFCIPGNEKIFDYWDRVEDRQYKLRHCMNIDGVKRTLALFQPPIDPALLVAAFAAGLSVEDVLNSLYGDLPAYRFSYLVEKAKSFAGTVQGFGNALLSALEKKDSEALTLLRSTQEQNILKMTKDVKKKAIEEAKANLQSTLEGMVNVVNRVTQYQAWIEENLNGWERTQQISLHTSSVLSGIEPIFNTIASIAALLPNVGAPTAMTFGGEQLKGASENGARIIKSLAQVAGIISSSAGLEASFQRRAQDWEFQLKTAEQEIKQVQQQIAAATIRLAIAEKDLEIHEKQIEQAAEVHDFYKNKFSGLGLYTYMAKTLNNLHRMAYNTALDMAKQAEAAYKFETGEDDYFEISRGAFWDASRVGLLSGESLTLELQKLEANFINWNQRQMEIRQSFSMRIIAPEQLLELRDQGKCTFTIPEWAFDMQYPGHYRRRIVSVQITIPCVAGPYHNIAATLAMTKGSLRKDPASDSYATKKTAEGFTFRGSSMIATSSANNDGGQFDLNFRDERFLPFEGAGAVDSEWVLELPDKFRSFDYDTISDVIFHISYRSKYDGGTFKTDALDHPQNGLVAKINGNNNGGTGLRLLISLKEEFPDALFQLQTNTNLPVAITLDNSHLPMFARATTSFTVKVKIASNANWGNAIVKSNGKYPISLTPGPNEDVFVKIEYKL